MDGFWMGFFFGLLVKVLLKVSLKLGVWVIISGILMKGDRRTPWIFRVLNVALW